MGDDSGNREAKLTEQDKKDVSNLSQSLIENVA